MQTRKQPMAACDPKRLKAFLDSEGYEIDDAELVAHLDACHACQERMQAEAGDHGDWRRATEYLQPSMFDEAGRPDYSAATLDAFPVNPPQAVRAVLDELVPSEDPNHLGRLGTYEIIGVVGVGGMGIVLKAIDPSLDRIVAVKVMSPQLANNDKARQRFAREAKAAAAVLHPNVIPIHSVSSDGKLPYLVMSCIRGGSLQKRIERDAPLPIVELLRISAQVASGLEAAHEQGLVHRDIKPENILLEEGVERVTITDFGLARAVDDNSVTQLGAIAGTPQYMSPEQARGDKVDQQSDLFSLGCVMYTLGTGRPPFRDETSYGVMRKIIDESPQPMQELNPAIPDWLVVIIEKLMAKSREDRFASAQKVQELLERCLSHVQQPSANPLPEILRRRPLMTKVNAMKFLIAGVTLAVLASGSYVARQVSRAYSPTNFGTLIDRSGGLVESLPDEFRPQTVGRVTIGDRERILGGWQVLSEPLKWDSREGKHQGEWFEFERDHFTSHLPDDLRVPSKGQWKLDDEASPRRLVLRIDGAEQKALYRLQGDFLSIFYRPNSNDFPNRFPSPVSFGESGTLLILERTHYPEIEFSYADPSPEELELLATHKARIRFPNVTDLTPETAEELAASTGALELPALRELTPEIAQALAKKAGSWLDLRGVERISPEAAHELSKAECALHIGLTSLPVEVAEALGQCTGSLSLNRLTEITSEAAEQIAKTSGWLQLNGLSALDENVAVALAGHRHWLSLNGLQSISPEVADAFQDYRGQNLDLNGLRALDVQTAESLAKIRITNQFSMNAMRTLTPEVAAALVRGRHTYLSLQGLETLPEESIQILRRHQRTLLEQKKGQMLLPAKFDLSTRL